MTITATQNVEKGKWKREEPEKKKKTWRNNKQHSIKCNLSPHYNNIPLTHNFPSNLSCLSTAAISANQSDPISSLNGKWTCC